MTGFCKTVATFGDLTCNVEVRSVNHRYLDTRIFLPKQFQHLEEELKKKVKAIISRGKVDIQLTLEAESDNAEMLKLNQPMWQNIKMLHQHICDDLGEEVGFNMTDLFGVKGLFVVEPEEKEEEQYRTLFIQAVEEGIKGLTTMRAREGELLYNEIITHLHHMNELVGSIPRYQAETVVKQKERLTKNLTELDLKYEQDDPRILQEIGLFLDRIDISEELERFRSHLVHLEEMLQSNHPVGRKLDFLMQEFNREANTICSKSCNSKLTSIAVDLKCEIEKIREQVQNIE